MSTRRRIFLILVICLAVLLLLTLPIPGFMGPGLIIGTILWIFFHYRYVRQEELRHLLAAAAESNAPLAPALWAYVQDRPRGHLREFWISVLLLGVFYWAWYRRNNFDRKVERVALRLEGGYLLHEALLAVPGVASRETIMAAAIGENTGQLARCLRNAPSWRLAPVWLEAIPRLAYPLFLLLCIGSILAFHLTFIIPKFEKIFYDFKIKLPEMTEVMIGTGRYFVKYWYLPSLALLVLAGLVIVLIFSSTACWYCPGLGRLYRMHAQSRLLRMLPILLEAGYPLHQALELLTESGYFSGFVQNRMRRICYLVENGEPLAEALQEQDLLPRSMVPLVKGAERAHNLPWALTELGEHLAKRTVRISQRITLVIFPLTVIIAGLVVGFVVISIFMPLVKLIMEM